MTASWIIRVGPKSNNEHPYKRHTGEDTQRRGHVKMEAHIGAMWPQAKVHLEPLSHKWLKVWKDSPLEPRERA